MIPILVAAVSKVHNNNVFHIWLGKLISCATQLSSFSLLDFFMNLQKKESKTESILFFPDFCQSLYFMVSLNCQAMKILKFQRMLDIWKTFTSAFPTLTLTDWPQGNETKMPPKSPQMLVKQFWGTAWVLLKLKLNTPNRHNDSWPTAFATSNSKYFFL